MAELIPDDIYEKIFLLMDLRDLIRCKGVCKTWKYFISGPGFVKAHLNHRYNKNENGHKWIGEAVFWIIDVPSSNCLFIGSSNGLVCVHNDDFGVLVGNPSTREGRTLPPTPKKWTSCWGFGYDSLMDDYKVVRGDITSKRKTCFRVFSLKSNSWKIVGKVNYICLNTFCGLFCNGAIHWVMHPRNKTSKKVIISFDLSREGLKEIPQPDVDEGYMSLGLMEECLCIHRDGKEWVMKKYNDKRSWEMLPDNIQIQFKYGCCIFEKEDDTFHTRYQFIGNRMFRFEGCPTIVESLVSPHLQAENE